MAQVFDLQGSLTFDSGGFEKAVKDAIQAAKNLEAELKLSDTTAKAFEQSMSSARKAMNEVVDTTSEVTRETKQSAEAAEAMSKEVDGLRADLDKASKELEDNAAETKKLGERMDKAEEETQDLKEEVVKLGKEYDDNKKDANELENETKKLGDTAEKAEGKFSKFADFLKNGLGTAIKVGIGAVAGAATAIGGLVMQSVSNYGEFEQLQGGAQKIFEGMDFSKIQRDSDNAFKELNMNATEYFRSINLAGAAFTESMGSEKAYETARKGMLAISDFASGTGKDLNLLNEKFMLISRSTGSYQSIADQFAGILPQTSADFLEQAQSAGFLADSYKQLTEVPVAEYQAAVVDMLEKGVAAQNLSGNLAREGGETITGSIAQTKAAWEDLVTSFSNPNADLSLKISNFVESGKAALQNLIPTVVNAMGGVGTAISELAPVLGKEVPKLISKLLPPLLTAATSLITNLVSAVGSTLPTALKTLGKTLTGDSGLIKQLGGFLRDTIPNILDGILDSADEVLDVISELIEDIGGELTSTLPVLLPKVLEFIWTLFDKIANSDLFAAVSSLIMPLMESLLTVAEKSFPIVFELVPQVISDLFDTIGRYFDENSVEITAQLEEFILHLVDFIKSYIPAFIGVTIDIIKAIVGGLIENAPLVYAPFADAFEHLGEWLFEVSETVRSWISDGITKLTQKLISFKEDVSTKAGELVTSIVTKLEELPGKALEVGKNLVTGLWEGISGASNWLGDKISGFADGIISDFTSAFDIHSPSKVMETLVGKNLALGIGEGFINTLGDITDDMTRSLQLGVNELAADTTFSEPTAVPSSGTGINLSIVNNWDGVVISSELDMAEVVNEMSDKAVIALSERLEQLRIFDTIAYGGVVMS